MRALKIITDKGKERIRTLDLRERRKLIENWNTQVWRSEEQKLEQELSNPCSKASRLLEIMQGKKASNC